MTSPELQRGRGEVTLYLSRNQRGIIPVPLELQAIVPEKVWNDRIQVATQTASRYSKPLFERAWMMLALVCVILLPVILVPIIMKQLYTGDHTKNGYHFGVAPGIGFAMFFWTSLLFFIPVFVWKLVGRIQVKKILKHWAAEDRVMLDQTQFVPTWRIKTPSVFRDSIVLIITTPPPMATTVFHPAAYLPSYVTDPPQPPMAALPRVTIKNEVDNPFADFDEKISGHGNINHV